MKTRAVNRRRRCVVLAVDTSLQIPAAVRLRRCPGRRFQRAARNTTSVRKTVVVTCATEMRNCVLQNIEVFKYKIPDGPLKGYITMLT